MPEQTKLAATFITLFPATITAGFGSAAPDPLLPHRGFKAKENDFPPVGKTKSVSVQLQPASFQVAAIKSEE